MLEVSEKDGRGENRDFDQPGDNTSTKENHEYLHIYQAGNEREESLHQEQLNETVLRCIGDFRAAVCFLLTDYSIGRQLHMDFYCR